MSVKQASSDRSHMYPARWARVTAIALSVSFILSACAGQGSATFGEFASALSQDSLGGSKVRTYETVSDLLPGERRTESSAERALAVIVAEVESLAEGVAYRIDNGGPELTTLGFDSPDAQWRDASLNVTVSEVIDDGMTNLEVGQAIAIRVIVPLDWPIEKIEAAYLSKPRALVFLGSDALSDSYRVLSGTGEFYLPINKDGTLDLSLVSPETLSDLREVPRSLDDVRKAAHDARS